MPEDADEFIAAARAFRAALDAEDVEGSDFARQVRNALARVYLAAALLGPPTTAESDAVADRAPRGDDGRALGARLKARFGQHDVFVEVYDPSTLIDEDVEPFERALSQELVEIDEDVAEAIALLDGDRTDALWDVRWAFENHWGHHAVACLRPLHQLATYGVV